MQWIECIIQTAPQHIAALSDILTNAGFADLVVENQAELEEFLEKNRTYWDYIDESLQQHLQGLSQIKLYIEEANKAQWQRLDRLLAPLTTGDDRLVQCVEKKLLADVNWEENWKENYPPIPVGKRLLVLPYWCEDPKNGRLPVILDPGLTFGTGAHPSTRMVMEELEERVQPGARCLDLGSGSGILSIAALRLGAETAIGLDIDPKAEDIARENAAYNQFAPGAFTALTGNVLTDKGLMARLAKTAYPIVLVNIVADVIIGLAPVLPGFMDADSVLICSGILDSRLQEVCAALQNAGLAVIRTRSSEDWRCVVAKRRSV